MKDRRHVSVGRELFRFTSKLDWVNHAASRFESCDVPMGDRVCIDALGRICTRGLHFSKAERDEAYPVIVYDVNVEECS